MDIINIPTKFVVKEIKNLDELKKHLPKRFGLVSITQYNDYARKIYEILKNDYEIIIKEGLYGINVLGCYSEPANIDADTILLIGNGKFHAENILRKLKKKVIVYDPINGDIKIYYPNKNFDNIVEFLLQKLKNSNNIGIVLSIKPGQYYYIETKKIKEELEKIGKNVYLFIGDTIDFLQLLNFPFIDFWIFSACPRIIDDVIDDNINGITIDLVIKNLDKIRNINY